MKRTKSFRKTKKGQAGTLAEVEKILTELKEGLKGMQEGSYLYMLARIEIKKLEHSVHLARRRAPDL